MLDELVRVTRAAAITFTPIFQPPSYACHPIPLYSMQHDINWNAHIYHANAIKFSNAIMKTIDFSDFVIHVGML